MPGERAALAGHSGFRAPAISAPWLCSLFSLATVCNWWPHRSKRSPLRSGLPARTHHSDRSHGHIEHIAMCMQRYRSRRRTRQRSAHCESASLDRYHGVVRYRSHRGERRIGACDRAQIGRFLDVGAIPCRESRVARGGALIRSGTIGTLLAEHGGRDRIA